MPEVVTNCGPDLIGKTPVHPDLEFEFPKSACDYYALHQTSKHREVHDIYLIKDALLTVDYTRKYRYHFCIQHSDGTPFKQEQQQFIIEPQENEVAVSGRVAFADDRFTKFNVCHFLFDKLWRAACFKSYNPDSYAFLVVNDYIKCALSSLNMNVAELPVSAGNIVTYRIDELLVSTSTMDFRHPGNNFSPEAQNALHELDLALGLPNGKKGGKRIFVDRADARTRRIINRDDISSVLSLYDIETIVLDGMTIQEQISTFNSAELVVGVHGAGLSNAYFCRSSNTKVLEIFPPLCATADYWKLSMAKGFHYDAFIAADLDHPEPDYAIWKHQPEIYNRRDVFVDVRKFTDFLELNLK